MSNNETKRSYYIPDISDLLPIRNYICTFDCDKVYKNRKPFEMHLRKVHGVVIPEKQHKFFRCPVDDCDYEGRRLDLVRRHYQTTHMMKMYECVNCDRKFILESQLIKHICEIQKYTCGFCPKSFRLLSMRNRHTLYCAKKSRSIKMLNGDEHKAETMECDHEAIALPNACADTIENKDSDLSDEIIQTSFEQILRDIDNNVIEDPALINELAELTPLLLSLQSET